MKEITRIVSAYNRLLSEDKQGALATVVKVQGSSYRGAGARMLMSEDGKWTGAISGGCLEGDALRRSRQAMMQNTATVITYDTTDDQSEQSIGVGLGCNGIIDVLIEPLALDSTKATLELMQKQGHNRKAQVQATIFEYEGNKEVKPGNRILWHAEGKKEYFIENNTLLTLIEADMNKALEDARTIVKTYTFEDQKASVCIEYLHPGIDLIVFGAGYDCMPLVKLASELGWRVSVTEDCHAKVLPVRFPEAREVLFLDRKDILSHWEFTPHTAAVIMSHNYHYDLAVLEQLLQTDLPYIGLLGPRKRAIKMRDEMRDKGLDIDLNRVYNPIGLDIGAETPEEIALSIVSEIQAVMNKQKAGFLKDKDGFIHPRSEDGIRILKI